MIVTACRSDLRDLTPLLRALNALHVNHVPKVYHDEGSDAGLEAVLARVLEEDGQILVYRTQSTARGYLAWKPARPAVSAVERPRKLAVLDHIYVEPIWRRRGTGGRLIASFEAEIRAQGYTGWQASVHLFNNASCALMGAAGADEAVRTFVKRDLG